MSDLSQLDAEVQARITHKDTALTDVSGTFVLLDIPSCRIVTSTSGGFVDMPLRALILDGALASLKAEDPEAYAEAERELDGFLGTFAGGRYA